MAEVLQLWNQFEETFDQIYGNGEKVFNKYLPNQKEFQESFKNLVAKTDDVRKYTAKKLILLLKLRRFGGITISKGFPRKFITMQDFIQF